MNEKVKMLSWVGGGAALAAVDAAIFEGDNLAKIFEFSVYGAVFGLCMYAAGAAKRSLKI